MSEAAKYDSRREYAALAEVIRQTFPGARLPADTLAGVMRRALLKRGVVLAHTDALLAFAGPAEDREHMTAVADSSPVTTYHQLGDCRVLHAVMK